MKKTDRRKTDTTRRNLLTGAGLAITSGLLISPFSSAKTESSSNTCVNQAWDKPFTGKIPENIPEGYNILFITADQERFFDQYPCPLPGRDRLMKMGITFSNHQNNSNVCTSSRSVLYTGLHMPQTRMFDNIGAPWMPYDLDPKLKTIAHFMAELGYYAAYKGKWHLSRELEKPLPKVSDTELDIGNIPTPKLHKEMQKYGFNDYEGIGDIIGHTKGGYFYDSLTTGQTINWLRMKGRPMTDKGKPWFLAVNLVNPHDVMYLDTDNVGEHVQWHKALDDNNNSLAPTQPPENEIYQATWPNYPLPENRHQSFDEPGRPAAQLEYQKARAVIVGDFPDEDRRWRKLIDYYINCIRDNDTHLLRILEELDALGITDKTIVVFTADHGEMGGAHQMHGKGTCSYREQVNVPFVIAHPAYPGNQRCNALTCHLDIAPTLMALTGASADKRQQILSTSHRKGKDLSILLKQPEKTSVNTIRDKALYCYGMITYTDAQYINTLYQIQDSSDLSEAQKKQRSSHLHVDFSHRSGIRMLNNGRYKFTRYFSLRQHNTPKTWEELLAYNDLELYDLVNDPNEDHNLAVDKEQNKALIMQLNQQLNEIIAEEIGIDDGSFMPHSNKIKWDLTSYQFKRLIND